MVYQFLVHCLLTQWSRNQRGRLDAATDVYRIKRIGYPLFHGSASVCLSFNLNSSHLYFKWGIDLDFNSVALFRDWGRGLEAPLCPGNGILIKSSPVERVTGEGTPCESGVLGCEQVNYSLVLLTSISICPKGKAIVRSDISHIGIELGFKMGD